MTRLTDGLRFVADLYRVQARFARASGGQAVSRPRQICEMILLRMGPGRLRPEDYYLIRAYRRDLSLSDKLTYISNPAMGCITRDRRWGIIADDKLLTYSVLRAEGIPVPEVQAILHPIRTYAGAAALRCEGDLRDYLLSRAEYPFFAKPIQGIYSKGSLLVRSPDSDARALLLGDGSSMPLQTFVRDCADRAKGFLFQELLHPHPEVAGLCGDRLCTVRMIVLLDGRGPRLFCALWKIAAAGNMADNYWRKGNMLALLDKERGVVKRCTTGLGPELQAVERHPESGRPLAGFALPDWREAVDLTLRAARVFPGLPIQAWDIAITSKGPLPLEVNVFGSPFLPQIANDEGLLQGEFRAFVDAQRG